MSVTGTQTALELIPLVPNDDRDPSGLWYSRLSVAGDATGGIATVSLTPALSSVVGRVWSLEGVRVEQGGGTVANIELQVRPGYAIGGLRPLFGGAITGLTIASGNHQSEILSRLRSIPFLLATDLTWFADLVAANPGAGGNVLGSWWGWMWLEKALKAPGGPRRPT